jgi:hypothetical protein
MEPCGSMDSGVTTDGMSARSVPAASSTPPAAEPRGSSTGPVTGPAPRQPAKGSEVRVMRCPIHGVAYDSEREVCPDCAKGAPPRKEPTDTNLSN